MFPAPERRARCFNFRNIFPFALNPQRFPTFHLAFFWLENHKFPCLQTYYGSQIDSMVSWHYFHGRFFAYKLGYQRKSSARSRFDFVVRYIIQTLYQNYTICSERKVGLTVGLSSSVCWMEIVSAIFARDLCCAVFDLAEKFTPWICHGYSPRLLDLFYVFVVRF